MKFAATLLFVLALSVSTSSVSAQTTMGRRAPGFSLMDVVSFKQHDIQDYRGKVVLIDIMRTDCPHCQTLTKTLEQVKTKYGAKIQILSVVNPPDNQNTVKKYIADNKVTSPMLFDCGQMAVSYLQVGPNNPTVSVPHVFIVDKNGLIQKDISETTGGGLSLQNLSVSIDSLLK